MGIIYCAENLVNGKKYIGQTTIPFDVRKKKHIDNALKNNRVGRFYDALREYGEGAFFWRTLEECIPEEILDEREIFFIAENKSFGSGYNMTEGGSVLRGYHHSQKTRDKIGKSMNHRSNKDHFISRYGEEVGMIKYNEYIEDMKTKRSGKTRLSGYIEKFGEEEGKRRYNIFIESIKEARKRKGSTNKESALIELYGEDDGKKRYKSFCNKIKDLKEGVEFSEEHKKNMGLARLGKTRGKYKTRKREN